MKVLIFDIHACGDHDNKWKVAKEKVKDFCDITIVDSKEKFQELIGLEYGLMIDVNIMDGMRCWEAFLEKFRD